jgi:hypothetical protein
MGDWSIASGETEDIRHQIGFYTGDLSDVQHTDAWEAYGNTDGMY